MAHEGRIERTERWLTAHQDDLLSLTQALVRLPSENRPPHGEEAACQRYVASWLRGLGLEPDVFRPDEVAGATEHEAWWPGRSYDDRACVVGRCAGGGGGRSLLFSGHVDVVPALGHGSHGFWDAEVVDGRLYGRGALDMKGGVACYLHALRCLVECEAGLAGDLLVETVVDEEYGGANGTLACRLRGYEADGGVLPEPTGLQVGHATRGGRQFRVHATGGLGGMPLSDDPQPSALVSLARLAAAFAAAEEGRGAPLLQMLLRSGEELPWGTGESIPADGVLELWAEILPGTSQRALEAEVRGIVASVEAPPVELRLEPRTRFLAATWIDPATPIVSAAAAAVRAAGGSGELATVPFACDAFVFNDHSRTPVVVLGPGGASAHAPDEHVLVDDLLRLARAYVRLALDWCGPAAAR